MKWTYYKLLMWKNFLIKSRHKIELCVETFLPMLFFCMVLGIRSAILPQDTKNVTLYQPVPIDVRSLDLLRSQPFSTVSLWEIDYTPAHPLLDQLIANSALDLSLDFRGFNTSTELENFIQTNHSFVGVVFNIDDIDSLENGFSRNFTYHLRFPGSLRTADISSQITTWQTNKMFPAKTEGQGPREKDSNAGGNPSYINEGFIAVQNAISSNFIKLSTNNSTIVMPDIELQRFPYPPYVNDPIIAYMESSVGVLIVLAFMFPCIQAVKYITVEKELQLKETMKIMGLSTSLHWIAWFTTVMIPLCILVVVLMIFFRIPWFADFSVAIFTRSSWTLLTVVFLVYAISCISFSFMMSSFFKKASIAGPVSALAWFITYIPYSFTVNMENGDGENLSIEGSIILSLFSNTACPYACAQILNWEAINIGAQWDNLFESPIVGSDYTLGLAVVMMIVDSILYMLITLYVEKIMPGSYGLSYKWYFPLTKSFWLPNPTKYKEENLPPTSPVRDGDRFEPEIGSKNAAGIQLVNLRKHFGHKVAVDGLNIKMYENQITILLGHNGAGKTTTISMITGLIAPTDGTAYVNGYNMRTDLNEIRRNLGFCPQHNILFDELTVEEHIIFYSILKGIPKDRIQGEVQKYVKILELGDKRKAQSRTLSGGMKRKLSMCIALCADSKVVLCDEPSAGMDPAARRSLWELLQNEKMGRTILLTTHLMDEADVLGDRIAIMSEGKLKCSGTPFFLKKRFGTGYKLICSKRLDCNIKLITDLIHEFIPDASIKSEVGAELIYQLPEKDSNLFEPMLRKLESTQTELGLNGYGISMTTLEDVFMRTGTEEECNASKANLSFKGSTSTILVDDLFNVDSVPIVGPKKRYTYLWRAMFYKKSKVFVRNWHLFLLQLGVPMLFIILGYFISETSNIVESMPPLAISLEKYDWTMTFLRNRAENSTVEDHIEQSYISMFHTFPENEALKVINKSVEDEILALSERNVRVVNRHYMVAATLGSNGIIGWFNNQAFHTAPLTLNLIHNAIAKALLGSDYSITVINDPLPLSTNYKLNELKGTGSMGFQIALNTTFAMAYVSSIFIMFLITERVSRSKLLQFVSGVRASVFWIVHFVFDILVFIVVVAVITLVMFALQQNGFKTAPQLGRLFLTFVLYGFSSLPFAYLFSFYFDEPATGLARLSIIHICTGDALFILGFVLSIMNLGNTLANIAIIFPNFALAQAISNQATQSAIIGVCESVAMQMGITVQDVCELASSSCCDLNPFGWNVPGNGRPYVAMLVVGCLMFMALIVRERLSNQAPGSCCKQTPPMPQELQSNYDDDVQNEKIKVSMMQRSEIDNKKLVMRNITKFYSNKFPAVNRVSVAVERGECFGLLGVNGAGKTSTFKMMTGDEPISYGDVWVEGNHVEKDKPSVYELIGYCPQFDALLMDFTGMEMLTLFATLRGVPIHLIKSLTQQLSVNLAFEKHLHKQVKDYSGGNRRKLSTAVALLGNPHLVFLDEPTAGVDPASRRKLWDVVCHVRDIGKAIILTSHSMEECEALCTRIAIMVNGEFKCIGSAQYLKNRYSPGITLIIKLGKPVEGFRFSDAKSNGSIARPPFELDYIGLNVVTFIDQHFQGTFLKTYHKRLLTFEIPANIMPYSDIFGLMESNKESLNIEDYSLNQGTLEQVFLSFTNSQCSR